MREFLDIVASHPLMLPIMILGGASWIAVIVLFIYRNEKGDPWR
jgi:hypothetical protein